MAGRILVIEDDPASLELMKYLLSCAGHEVRGAADGATGLRAALENSFDLILCDLQMPALTGYEVIERLRADSGWCSVPIVAITANSMPGDREAVLAAGFAEHMTKPIDPETFLSYVDGWMTAGTTPEAS